MERILRQNIETVRRRMSLTAAPATVPLAVPARQANRPRAEVIATRIAVVLHAFHRDVLVSCLDHLAHIREPFDLIVTTPWPDGDRDALAILDRYPEARLVHVPNRGRDVGAFLSVWPLVRGYELCLKLHTKKGTTQFADLWRALCLKPLVGSAAIVDTLINAFDSNERLALAGPSLLYKSGRRLIGGNGEWLRRLDAMIGHPARSADAAWGFFAGTMFWFRPRLMSALDALTELPFEPERGLEDGGIEHAVERLFGSRLVPPWAQLGLVREAQGQAHVSYQDSPGLADEEPHLVTFAKLQAAAESAEALRGNLDRVRPTEPVLRGWLAHVGDPRPRRAVLRLEPGGEFYVDATMHRGDLQKAGINSGRHAFEFSVPARFRDDQQRRVSLIDLVSGKLVAQTMARWELQLPDLFEITSRATRADHVVVMTGYTAALARAAGRFLSTLDESFDLLTVGLEPFRGDLELPNVQARIHLESPAEVADAALLVQLVNAGALDRYRAVCWFDPSQHGALTSGQGLFGYFAEEPDVGLIASGTVLRRNADGAASLPVPLPRPHGRRHPPHHELPCGVGTLCIGPLPLSLLRAMALDATALMRAPQARMGIEWLLGSFVRDASQQHVDLTKPAGTEAALGTERKLRTVAFYLPQFHPIPENDLWWGPGFTEWTNVTRARPLFQGHLQPRLPSTLGFYDLRLPQARAAQAELARQYRVDAFCYYYYWFNGRKLLNQPIEAVLASGEPNFPFCVCWANENWTRSWDGQNRHVLLEQKYGVEELRALVYEFIAMMHDARYLRHEGKPILLVYRITAIPGWLEIARMWRAECREAGLGEIHLCAVRFGLEPLEGDPQDHGVDAYVLFPPHESVQQSVASEIEGKVDGFSGQLLSYEAVIAGDLARFEQGYPWPVHRGAMTGWDNTARRGAAARVFVGSTPSRFRSWVKGIVQQERQRASGKESLLFINAWNEWAEGTTLEPDQKFGLGNLEAVRSVLSSPGCVGHPDPLPAPAPVFPQMHRLEGHRTAHPLWPTVMVCGHMVGQQLFGGERSFLDVLDGLQSMRVNVVVTLPPGEPYRYKRNEGFDLSEVNPSYLEEVRRRCISLWVFPYPWLKERPLEESVVRRFMHLIVEYRVDLVHANTIMLREPLEAARRLRRPTMVHAREMIDHDESLKGFIGWDADRIRQLVGELSDHLIANSEATARMFRHRSTYLVQNCVDTRDLDLENSIDGPIRFGIVSSNQPKKGIADFVEVARLCEQRGLAAEFLVIGPENDFIRKLREDVRGQGLPSNLRFAGYQATPREAMALVNVLLNLSHFAESFGRTVAEAAAARRPVVVYRWGALPELVRHGQTGFVAPYRDTAAIAGHVQWLCEHPQEISRMGERGRELMAARFSREMLRSRLAAAYRPILQGLAPAPQPRALTILIPVYNAHDEVRGCLESVARHTALTDVEVLVIDDGSTDSRIGALLDHHVRAHGFVVLRNDSNQGYTRTINIGIRHARDRDVILLNSDTSVDEGWTVGLRAAAYSAPDVGTVTAMSDNAGAFSFPVMGVRNLRPQGQSQAEYTAAALQAAGHCSPVELPTGSGFCMYIRRDLFERIGLFDEVTFPRGYGEENDFCMRALRAGRRNLLTPWAFVHHVRSASFGAEKQTLIKAGVEAVERLYPDYVSLVKEAFSSPAMRALREATTAAGSVPQRTGPGG
jgi:lipopolysaccharide biosynthesis protein/GT2 family glycosyltransferase/glycosyltransferase involved in cell wall biosynthesis